MLRGLYMAGTGMLTQINKMDVISNNLSNVNTNNYKEDELVTSAFHDVLLNRLNDGSTNNNSVGNINYGVYTDEVKTSFEQGSLEHTGDDLDIALQGQGFLTVAAPQGTRYIRGGSFQVNSQGYLATAEGYILMGSNGPVKVDSSNFAIDKAGNVSTANGIINNLNVINFSDTNKLRKEGNSLFNTTAGNNTVPFTGEVVQGSVEHSNVNIIKQMVNMMETNRNYESNQRVAKMFDDSLNKAVNDVGKV